MRTNPPSPSRIITVAQTGARNGPLNQERSMKYLKAGALLLAVVLFQAAYVSAQEAEERVVDEVVAVVDNRVMSLSVG
jgi:hypothetical protein